MTIQTPLVLFAFRRPEKLEQLLQKLVLVPFSKLYLFCDGPRHDADKNACMETQCVAQTYAQRYPIELVIRPHNYGVFTNVVDALGSVFLKHSQAMIFEDDIHPKDGCIEFLEKALKSYRDHSRIFSIGCYHRPILDRYYDQNVFLSPRFNCWGWATWADRWRSIQAALQTSTLPFQYYDQVPETAGMDIPQALRDHHLRQSALGWDVQVAMQCLKHGWWQVQPKDCMIDNVGLDGSGTHIIFGPGKDTFEGCWPLGTYDVLPQNIQPKSEILAALEASYSDPRINRFRRWRRKWKYRLKMALSRLHS